MVSTGVGAFLLLSAASTSDFRDELQYADEETRTYHESRLISPNTEVAMGALGMAALIAGAIGIHKTEENKKQR